MNNNPFGSLLNKNNIELNKHYFKEMVKLLGVNVLYRAPRDSKRYDDYGELDTYYCEPELVGCIFDAHPTQQTLKKMGWVSELNDTSAIIHVPFDLPKLQEGALFIIPDTFNPKEGKVFRVIKLGAELIYPASIACELAPEFANTFERSQFDHKNNNFSVLADVDE